MSEEQQPQPATYPVAIPQRKQLKAKRDIFRFNGERPTAINLEHVTSMTVEASRITFNFFTNAVFIDLENDEAARLAFEQLLGVWSTEPEQQENYSVSN